MMMDILIGLQIESGCGENYVTSLDVMPFISTNQICSMILQFFEIAVGQSLDLGRRKLKLISMTKTHQC